MRILSVGLFVIELHVVIWTKEHLSKGFTQHLLVNMLATGVYTRKEAIHRALQVLFICTTICFYSNAALFVISLYLFH